MAAMKTCQSGMPDESVWTGFFQPAAILGKLGLSAACGDLVEFGCGYGTFSIPAAKIVCGTVHALDLDPTTPRGPSMEIRPRPEQCRGRAEQVGFRLLGPGIVDLPPYDYGMVLHGRQSRLTAR